MLDHQDEINYLLKPLQFIGFSRLPRNHNDIIVENSLSLYTTFELLTVLFGFIIFMGAITGVACVCTGRKRYRKKFHKNINRTMGLFFFFMRHETK